MLRNKTTDQRFEANMSILREERIKLKNHYDEAIRTVGLLAYTIQELENKIEELSKKYEAITEKPITALEAGTIQRQTNAWVLEDEPDPVFELEPERIMMPANTGLTALEAGHITRDTNAWVPDDESDELFASAM
jgi:hypothetical protein